MNSGGNIISTVPSIFIDIPSTAGSRSAKVSTKSGTAPAVVPSPATGALAIEMSSIRESAFATGTNAQCSIANKNKHVVLSFMVFSPYSEKV
jgi:hypothetical protein